LFVAKKFLAYRELILLEMNAVNLLIGVSWIGKHCCAVCSEVN